MSEGPNSPVSLSIQLDATHAVNRVVDHWFAVFTNGMQQHQADPACIFPGGLNATDIDHIRNHAVDVRNHSHDHQMSHSFTDPSLLIGTLSFLIGKEARWDLQMTWRTFWFDDGDGQRWAFMDDCQAACAYPDPVDNTFLEVSAKFGHPWFTNHCAQMPVTFSVALKDGEGNNLHFSTPLINFQLDAATGTGWQTH